jgi:hypothetical protein
LLVELKETLGDIRLKLASEYGAFFAFSIWGDLVN